MLRSPTPHKDLMIPQEILDSIIDLAAEEVDVDSDGQKDDDEREEEEYPPLSFQQVKLLRSLSLVSRGCCLRARKHLFAQIRLALQYSHKATPLHNLATVLQSNERLRACPRLLELRTDRVSLEHADLANILALLPCLRVVRIGSYVGLNAYFDWQRIPEEVRKTLFDLRKTSPHVENLELYQFVNLDISFVLGWQVIQKLTLENCRFADSYPKDDCSLPTLRQLHLIGPPNFLDILAAWRERAAPAAALQSLAIQIRSYYEMNIWSFLSSSLAHSLKTLKVDRLGASMMAPPMPLPPLSLTSLSLRITASDGARVQFPEVIALGRCRSQLETITLDIQYDLDERIGWDIGVAWDALDLALASLQFPYLKGVNARVKYVLDSNGCFEAVARDMASDNLTEGGLFPRVSSLSRKIDLKVTYSEVVRRVISIH